MTAARNGGAANPPNPLNPLDRPCHGREGVGINVATNRPAGIYIHEEITLKNFKKGIGAAFLSLAFVLTLVVATSGTTHAQYRNDDGRYGRDSKEARKEQKRIWKQRRKQRREARREDRRDGVYNDGRYGRNDGYGNDGYYGNNGGYGNNGQDQAELNRGYQQGLQTGASDGQRNQSYDPQRSRYFKNASTQAFREGFVRGYDQGYRQYAGNGGYNNGSGNGGGLGAILGSILGRP